MNNQAIQAGWISYAIFFVVLVAVVAFRMRRMSRERPLKIGQLWIVPAIYALLAAFLYYRFPPHGMMILWCVVALGLGALAGWWRGKMMHIAVNPETHEISQKGSMAAMLFLLGIILVRYAAREIALLGGSSLHLDLLTVTDLLIAFALGLLTAQRIEMYLRAKRLLDEARSR